MCSNTCIREPHKSHSDFMFDICDGSSMKSDPFFVEHPSALQVILNTDDIEIVKPIGSHTKKHKLSIFYYTLGNIPPELRSRLHVIQLLAVAKSKDIRKRGPGKLLADFIEQMNVLSSADGMRVSINGMIFVLRGKLVLVPCDTLAAQWLGGFKEGVSFAKRPCRTCHASQHDSKTKFLEKDFQSRDELEHRVRCNDLQDDLSKAARKYWSREWGINGRSCLHQLSHVKLCSVFVHDPMHIFLEGLIPHELKYMLTDFIWNSRYFTLQWFNARLQSFPYSYLEADSRPESLDKEHIMGDGKLKQTSAATLNLICILPFVIASKIPRGNLKWRNFLRLVQMTLLYKRQVVHPRLQNTVRRISY